MSSAGRYGPREGWLSVVLLAAVLWCVTHSVYEAEWAAEPERQCPWPEPEHRRAHQQDHRGAESAT